MSMIRCDLCEDLIDSDEDCDCFARDGSAACKWCREEHDEEDEQ